MKGSSSTGQSSGLQNRRLGVQVPPALQEVLTNIRRCKKKGCNVVDQVHDEHETKESLGLFGRIGLFYRQVVYELKKVVWPTREQLTTYTAVVMIFVVFIIAVVSLLDLVLTKVVFLVFG